MFYEEDQFVSEDLQSELYYKDKKAYCLIPNIKQELKPLELHFNLKIIASEVSLYTVYFWAQG